MSWGAGARSCPRPVVLAFALTLGGWPALFAQDPPPAVLAGRVVDALSGEPLAGVRVSVRGSTAGVTDAAGRFTLAGIPAGPNDVDVATAGYEPSRLGVRVAPGIPDLEVRLERSQLKRSEEVAVVERPADPAAPAARLLGRAELQSLSSALVDDPLRSVQSLPGVASGDDFGATFAARGQGFPNVGFYIDGVLMAAPFHTVRDVNDGFSLTVLSGEVVDALSLVSGAAPARYGDRTGAVLSATIREGSRERLAGRASLGVSGLSATLEGPLGQARKTSWLVSVRKSYLGYVLQRLDEGAMGLGFHDATLKLGHHPSETQTLSFSLLHGRSRWTNATRTFRPQDTRTAEAGTDLATLGWRWTPTARWWIDTGVFFSSETGRNRTFDGTDRVRSADGQWGARGEATHVSGPWQLQAGVVARGLSEDVAVREYQGKRAGYQVTVDDGGRGDEESAYVEGSWAGQGGRLRVTGGGRADRFGWTAETRVTPRAAIDWRFASATRLVAAFGRYVQFPRFEELLGRGGSPALRAERATHLVVGLERALGGGASVRVEAYGQALDGFIANPEGDWRLVAGKVVGADARVPLQNLLSGRSRGIEVTVQRRGLHGVSGWAAYAFGHARWREGAEPWFDGDFDQRHTVTVFGAWRVRPTVELSTKYRYGSGFPVPGYLQAGPGSVFLSAARNTYRPGAYSRWDLRAGKAFVFDRWRLSVYAEVLNVLDRRQTRYAGIDSLDVRTGRVVLENDTLFPRLPSAGVAVEF